MYCWNCGNQADPAAIVCVRCGVALKELQPARPEGADKKLACALTAILLAGLGIHKFILGYTGEGLTMLLVTVLTLGIGWIVMGPISIIEGIIYLTKSDEEFVATYIRGHKGWF